MHGPRVRITYPYYPALRFMVSCKVTKPPDQAMCRNSPIFGHFLRSSEHGGSPIAVLFLDHRRGRHKLSCSDRRSREDGALHNLQVGSIRPFQILKPGARIPPFPSSVSVQDRLSARIREDLSEDAANASSADGAAKQKPGRVTVRHIYHWLDAEACMCTGQRHVHHRKCVV